jgi:hypothetical protein
MVPETSSLALGAVLPIPTLEFDESRLSKPDSILRAVVEELAISTVDAEPNERVDEGAVVPIPILELEVSTLKKLLTLNAVVDESRVRLTKPDEEVKDKAPVVKVKPLEAVSRAAEVMVPDEVVEILLEVDMVLAVDMVPNPEAMEPEVRAPTETREEAVTPAPRVEPDKTSLPAIL